MSKANKGRPHIPKSVQTHLWLRAGGRCEFRGCNKILYEDDVTQDPLPADLIIEIALRKVALDIRSASTLQKLYAKKWLKERGYSAD